jgi:hypothetical protein
LLIITYKLWVIDSISILYKPKSVKKIFFFAFLLFERQAGARA